MASFLLLIIIVSFSAAMCYVSIRRLYNYINRYRIEESVYTLLFGVVRLRHFVWFYFFMVGATSVIGLYLAFYFLL